MFCKVLKFFFPIIFILISCSNDQVSDIQKSAAYNLDDYNIIIRSPNGLCVNSDLVEEKSESLILILTECIKNPDTNDLIRRPISSLITVKFQKEISLNEFKQISDFIKGKDVELKNIFKKNNLEINKYYQKDNTIYMSLLSKNRDNTLGTGNKIWKTLSINENVLISATAYGFSRKNSNYTSYKELENKLKRVINSIEIRKINKSSST
tara:strand:- start:3627 stop:4253 length:627 start_codon:yes stop_codon:yes gene_type:complete